MALKGKTVIELTNVKTGEVERHEDENMVTNAMASAAADVFRLNNPKNSTPYMPFFPKFVNGILLFEGTHTESADNTLMTLDDVITAWACTTDDTSNPKRGSFNANESKPIQNGYKFVFDFTSDKGNGVISSASLTHIEDDIFSYTNQFPNLKNFAESYAADDSLSFTNILQSSNLSDALIARASRSSDGEIKLYMATRPKNNYNAMLDSCAVQTGVPFVFTPNGYSSVSGVTMDDEYTYFISCRSESALSSYPMYITKLRTKTREVVSNITVNKSGIYSPWYSKSMYDDSCPFDAIDEYIYWQKDGSYNLYVLNTKTGDVVTTSNYSSSLHALKTKRGNYFWSAANNYVYKLEDDHTTLTRITDHKALNSDAFSRVRYSNGGVTCFSRYLRSDAQLQQYVYLVIERGILFTINNLSSPVTKTADQTMKITYTLTEVAE